MGIIRSPKDQALVPRGGKVVNDEGKQIDKSPIKKENSNEPLGSKRIKNNGKGNTLCSYYRRGFHPDSSCMRRQIDEMNLLLKKKNISVPASVRKDNQIEDTKGTKYFFERGHALKASCSTTRVVLIDSGASNHLVAFKESFSSL